MSKSVSVSCRGAGTLPLSKIHALQGELKSLSKQNFDRLKGLILSNGITSPIHVWKDPKGKFWNLDGHQRARVLEKLSKDGMSIPPVPVVFVEAKSVKHAKEILLSNVSQFGEASEESLYEFMNEAGIKFDDFSVNFDVPGINLDHFGEGYFKDVNFTAKEAMEDDVPEVKEKATTRVGQIFKLGDHRLLCGDSTDVTQVARLMGGKKAILMVTDPPYGVNLNQSWRDKALGNKALGPGNANTVVNDDRSDWFDAWYIAPVQIAYVWHASSFTDVVMGSLRRAEFDVRQQIIWNKSVMVMGRSAYHFKHEPCWYAVKKGCDANWVGDRKQITVWDAAAPNHIMSGSTEDKTDHPTQKPVALYEIPIANHTRSGDSIFEPFGGSGTAIIAAEKMNRRCFMMELDPHYCDVIIRRWERYSGKKAELIGDAPNKSSSKKMKSKRPSSDEVMA